MLSKLLFEGSGCEAEIDLPTNTGLQFIVLYRTSAPWQHIYYKNIKLKHSGRLDTSEGERMYELYNFNVHCVNLVFAWWASEVI